MSYNPVAVEKRFKTKGSAETFVRAFKLKYGYRPSIFKLSKEGKFKHFLVVKPKGIKPITRL